MSIIISSDVGDIKPGITRRSTAADTTVGRGENSDEESVRCSDEEESCSSSESSTLVVIVSNNEVGEKSRSSSSSSSCLSERSAEDAVDLERGGGVTAVTEKRSVHLSKVERDCRICHLSLDGSNPDSGLPIELGCSCKDDLAAAHKHCAEAWFKIRGNKTCEICGSTARNIVGLNEVEQVEQWNEANDTTTTNTQPHPGGTRRFWQGHRFLNFLLACMVFAFVISWLFHFNVPS